MAKLRYAKNPKIVRSGKKMQIRRTGDDLPRVTLKYKLLPARSVPASKSGKSKTLSAFTKDGDAGLRCTRTIRASTTVPIA